MPNRSNGTIYIIDPTDNSTSTITNIGIGLHSNLTFHPDGMRAYLHSGNTIGTIEIAVINVQTHSISRVLGTASAKNRILFSPDGSIGYIPEVTIGTPSTYSTKVFDPATNTITDTIADFHLIALRSGDNQAWANNSLPDSDTNSPFPRSLIQVSLPSGNVVKAISLPLDHGPSDDVEESNDGTTLYVTSSNSGLLYILDIGTGNIIETVFIGDSLSKMALTADGTTLYVGRVDSNQVAVIDFAPDEDGDGDGDGISDDDDACPDENAMGLDADQDGCIDSAAGLSDLIDILPSDALDETLKNSLTQKVSSSEQQATTDNLCAAIIILEAFQNVVESQHGKKITNKTAALLIAYAANPITQFQDTLSEIRESYSLYYSVETPFIVV